MNPNREDALFALALEKPADKRAAYLDAICDGDAALRQRLETLLAAPSPAILIPPPADPAGDRLRTTLTLSILVVFLTTGIIRSHPDLLKVEREKTKKHRIRDKQLNAGWDRAYLLRFFNWKLRCICPGWNIS